LTIFAPAVIFCCFIVVFTIFIPPQIYERENTPDIDCFAFYRKPEYQFHQPDYSCKCNVEGSLNEELLICVFGAGQSKRGTSRADWQRQLSLQNNNGFRYAKNARITTDSIGVYSEDRNGKPVYITSSMLTSCMIFFVSIDAKTLWPEIWLYATGRAGERSPLFFFWWRQRNPPDYNKWGDLI